MAYRLIRAYIPFFIGVLKSIHSLAETFDRLRTQCTCRRNETLVLRVTGRLLNIVSKFKANSPVGWSGKLLNR